MRFNTLKSNSFKFRGIDSFHCRVKRKTHHPLLISISCTYISPQAPVKTVTTFRSWWCPCYLRWHLFYVQEFQFFFAITFGKIFVLVS